MNKIRVAATNVTPCFNKKKNLEKLLSMIEKAAQSQVQLIVFPEQVLQGYLPCLVGPLTSDTLRYQVEHAECVPEGNSTQAVIEAAKRYHMYVAYGMTERSKTNYGVLYNTAVLVGPEGYIGSYRKVHQPVDEKHVYYPGDKFSVFDTPIGRIGLEICVDSAFPESARELALQGAENIIHPIGRILASTGSEGENLVYSDIDVNQDIAEAKAVVLQEWHKERRPSVYRHLSSKLVDVQE